MTDLPVPDVDPLDELASAVLDGEAAPEELEGIDPEELAARVAQWRAVAERVAAPVEVGDDQREAAIAAAVAALPGAGGAGAAPAGDLAARRATRQAEPARRKGAGLPLRWLGAAAAAAMVVVGVGIAVNSSGGTDDEAAIEAADEAGAAMQTSGADSDGALSETVGGEGGGPDQAPAADRAGPPLVDLGAFADAEALAASATAVLAVPATELDTSAATTTGQATLCAAPADFTATPVALFTGTIGGEPASAVAGIDATGTTQVFVFDAACAVLYEETIAP